MRLDAVKARLDAGDLARQGFFAPAPENRGKVEIPGPPLLVLEARPAAEGLGESREVVLFVTDGPQVIAVEVHSRPGAPGKDGRPSRIFYFSCPSCGRVCRQLYRPVGRPLGCRVCLRLTYADRRIRLDEEMAFLVGYLKESGLVVKPQRRGVGARSG